MSDLFAELDQLSSSQGAGAALDRLIESLQEQKQYHDVFGARLMKKKLEMGLPLVKPTSFEDVPREQQDEFEETYVAEAREVGKLFLQEHKLSDAWMYFRTIREHGPVAEYIDNLDIPTDPGEELEQILSVALYEGANPVKGLEIMLRTNGTCNTITTLDQLFQQLEPKDRQEATKLLIRELYQDLSATVRAEVEQRIPMIPPGESLRGLITGRDWLFQDNNYHIDVSHLNAVVRFARSLTENGEELQKAIELAEYGTQLDPQYQYPGDAPFANFYEANRLFLSAIAGEKVDQAVTFFQNELEQEPDEYDKPPIASVLLDLLMRVNRPDDAIELARRFAEPLEQIPEFSFAEFCAELGRLDALKEISRERQDFLGYMAALGQDS